MVFPLVELDRSAVHDTKDGSEEGCGLQTMEQAAIYRITCRSNLIWQQAPTGSPDPACARNTPPLQMTENRY